MKLYLVTDPEVEGLEMYDALVVCADSEEAARAFRPPRPNSWRDDYWPSDTSMLTVIEIGEAHPSLRERLILGSFNQA
jgi:hypothetical protein